MKPYSTLRAEIARKGIRQKDIADYLGIWNSSFCTKLSGKHCFSLQEAVAVQKKFFPEIPVEVLFDIDIEQTTSHIDSQ